MAVGIPAMVRPTGGSLGNMNPMDMMKSMMEMRNLQAQYQGVMQAGRDFGTSSNADEVRQKAANNPFAGFAMQQYEQASAYYRNAAQTGEINQLVGVNRAKAAILGGTDQATTLKLLSDAEAAAPPSERTWMGHLYDSLSGPMSDEEFQNKKIGLGITFGGLSAQEAYGAGGRPAPQLVRGPFGPSGEEVAVPWTGAGFGATGPLAGGLGGTGAPAPTPARAPTVLSAPPPGVADTTKEIQTAMTDASDNTPKVLKNLDVIFDTLRGFRAGGGAQARTAWGARLQALKDAGIPIPQSLIDSTANESLSDSQLFMAQIKPFVTEQMREAVGASGAGRIRAEVQAFLDTISASTDPNTIVKQLNRAKYLLQMDADRAINWPQYRDNTPAGMRTSDYYTWWNHNRHDQMVQSAGPGLDLGPFNPDEVKGTKEYQAVHGNETGTLLHDKNGNTWRVKPGGDPKNPDDLEFVHGPQGR